MSRMKGPNECQTRRTRRNKAKFFEIQALRTNLEQRDRYRLGECEMKQRQSRRTTLLRRYLPIIRL